MKRLVTIWLLCAGCIVAASAQTTFTQRLQEEKKGEGKVTVTQDKAIDELVNGPQVTVSTQPQKTITPQTTPQKTGDNKTTATTEQQHKPDSGNTQRPVVAEQEQQSDTTTIDDGRKKIMKGGYKINGYRVQVFAGGNSRDARIKAERIGKEINSLFPGEPVYVHFYSPRWICRMGNYRTYEEANERLRAVKKLGYSSAIIVKGKITVPYLPSSEPSNP
ncbi:MAG: SPOR domain-containing protein [Prevotella sp.]|nr:SPOR domain-containing protein [Prevotella sp.]